MNKSFTYLIFILFTLSLFSQSTKEWENCTEGLEGISRGVPIYAFENNLYLRSQPNTFYTTNLGINWSPFKRYDSNYKSLVFQSISFINKFKKIYILQSFELKLKGENPLSFINFFIPENSVTMVRITAIGDNNIVETKYYKFIR